MKIKRVFAAVLAALTLSATAVSLAACGGNSASSTAPSASASSAATSSAAAGKYASIEEIIQIPEFQNQLNSLRSSVSSMGVDLRVRAEGSALVYEYQLAETVSDERKQYLMTQMNSADGVTTFTNIVKELKNRTTVSNPTVIVRYLDKDGRTAVEKTYTENTEPVADYEMGSPGGAYSSPSTPSSGTAGSSASPTYPYTSYGSDTTSSSSGGTASSYGGGAITSYSGETPSSLEGTKWVLSKVSLNGVEMDAGEFIRFSQINYDEMTLEFKNGKVYSTGNPSYSAPNYVYKDGKLTTEGSSGTVNGNVMTFETNGNSMIYVRQ